MDLHHLSFLLPQLYQQNDLPHPDAANRILGSNAHHNNMNGLLIHQWMSSSVEKMGIGSEYSPNDPDEFPLKAYR